METFYIIVIVVAIVILIIFLTIIGIILSQKNNVQVFPPSKNTCPDYWASSVSGNTIVCSINANNINKGLITNDGNNYNYNLTTNKSESSSSTFFTPGLNSNTINFSDPTWASGYGITQQCALKKWANQTKVNWDGISNYNGC